MRTYLNKLITLLLFVSVYLGASAQSVPDTARISIGVDGGLPLYVTNLYSHILGASLHIDYPISRRTYITGSAGYNIFFASSTASSAPNGILNVQNANMKTVPLKIGIKQFIIRHFYVAAEVGGTLLTNKEEVYATNTSAFTYSPQVGMLFFLKKHTYIDAGIRYEGLASFYNDSEKYSFWAAHISYAFNL
ncbi:MAG: hypothetical protein ABI367_05420 [Mucilaginibacter sp.]